MQTGFYSSVGGMVTQFSRLDHIANNLANINTVGYKRDDVVIGDFQRLYQEERDKLPIENQTKDGAKFLNRSMSRVPSIVEKYRDDSLGGYLSTQNDLDMALSTKNAYFMVKTPEGIRYTRAGNFTLDGAGVLVTADGFPVLNKSKEPIAITATVDKIIVTSDGTISTKNKNTKNPQQLDSIGIASFENSKYLKKEGNNFYDYPIERTNEIMILDNPGNVRQGFIETSNINMVKEMVSLIETNRLVEMYQKVTSTHMDDLNNDAINKLATLRG